MRLLPMSCSLRVMPLARLAAVSITESSLQMASGLWSSSNSGLSISRMTPLVAMIIASGIVDFMGNPRRQFANGGELGGMGQHFLQLLAFFGHAPGPV